MAFQREIEETRSKLKQYQTNLSNLNTEFKNVGDTAKKTSEDISEITKATKGEVLLSLADNLSDVGDKIKEIGNSALSTYTESKDAIAKVNAYFGETGKMAEDGNLKFITSLTSVGNIYQNVTNSAQGLFDTAISPTQTMESNTRKLQQSLSVLGEKISNLVNTILPPLVAIISKVSDLFSKLPEPVQNFTIILGALIVAFTTLVPIIAALAVSIGALEVSILPIIAIIVGLSAVIAGVIAIVENWGAITQWFGDLWTKICTGIGQTIENVKNKVSSVLTNIKDTVLSVFDKIKNTSISIWNGIKNAIITPIENAKDKIKNIVDSIKGFFDNMKISLPNIKLPHFSLQGSFSLSPPSVPKLSIDWYKDGGIMTKPTVFGLNGSSLMAGGEAGAEAILPLKSFYTNLENILSSKLNTNVIERYLSEIALNSSKGLYLEDGTLVGHLLPTIDNRLGKLQQLNRRLSL